MASKRQPNRLDVSGFFATHSAFTLSELAEAMGGGERTSSARERVKYYLRRGRLRRLSRGVYATVPAGVPAERYQPDRYLVAAAVRADAVFSHHAALELLGFAHSDWNVCTVLTAHRRPALQLEGARVVFLQPPAALRSAKLWKLGTRRVERQGKPLRVTGPERTLLDGFRQPRLVGGLPELVESAAGFGVLDLNLLHKLLGLYGQRMLFGAAGWFLERYQKEFFVPDRFLKELEKRRPRSRQYLPRGRRRGGVLARRWNLVLPDGVVRGRAPGAG